MPFIELDQIEQRKILPGCAARFIHSDNMTISYWRLDPGATIPGHAHPHEQITTLIEGEMEMTLDGEVKNLTPGSVVVIPSNGEHSVIARTSCYVVDVFYPIREDYR